MIPAFTDADLSQLDTETPLLIDFSSTWCPPCRAMEPHLAAIAQQYAGKVAIRSCNTDENPSAAIRFSIQALPTFLLLHRGTVVDRIAGVVPRSRLVTMLERVLVNSESFSPASAATIETASPR